MGVTFYFDWEVSFMEWLQDIFSSPVWVKIFSFLSCFGEEFVCVAVLGILYWGLDKEFGKFIGINIASGLVFNAMIKNVFLRRRPYFDNTAIKILKVVEPDADIYDIAAQGYSFPSGHSSNAAAVFGSLALNGKKKWLSVIGIAIPLLTGISRFVLGAHYPTDVLFGWLLGALIIVLIPLLRNKLKNDYILYGILLIISIPGFFYCKSNDYYTGYGIMLGLFLGFIFEEKKVNFENTRSIIRIILRVLIGAGLFFGLNTLFKIPFSKEFLECGSTLSFAVRTLRYACAIFLIVGVYPMLFKYTAKIGKKEK